MTATIATKLLAILYLTLYPTEAWLSHPKKRSAVLRTTTTTRQQPSISTTNTALWGSLHGEDACFLPLKQLDQDYYAPRIIQIAGAYPGLTREQFLAVQSEPAPEKGQWTYDFSSADGPQLGTVALDGSSTVSLCEDPVVIIAEHTSLNVPLPKIIKDPVDLIVLVDRAKTKYGDRKFLVLDTPGKGLTIEAFPSKASFPAGAAILGQVDLVQIPWLPSMKPTRTGFMESDEYF